MLATIRLFAMTLVALFSIKTTNDSGLLSSRKLSIEDKLISCSPPRFHSGKGKSDFDKPPILPGWGHHHYSVSTRSDSAQLYFDQGLSMYYSYHPNEAIASFQASAKLDPHCAMAYWGQALAMGPIYNGTGYSEPDDLSPVLDKLKTAALDASSTERDLIHTLLVRYEAFKMSGSKHNMDDQYAKALQQMIKKYPADVEIKVLYVDAVMLEHAWDFWDKEGEPKEWTPELLDLCKQILVKENAHPGALHYQIHLCEASRHPEIGLHSADVLKQEMPGVPHMVHMTSHMYERNGYFDLAVDVNERAIANSTNYSVLGGEGFGGGADLHYRAVETVAAMNAGMYKKAMELASACRRAFSSASSIYAAQYILLPTFVSVRLGKWNEILETYTDASSTYTSIMVAFAKGLASVRKNNIPSARSHLDQISFLSSKSELRIPDLPLMDSPIKAVSVAHKLLEAEILASENNIAGAIASFKDAIRFEDEMVFYQPRNWLIPARQYLGAFLLKSGKIEEAMHCYEEDLERNPGNGWSQIGIYQCLMKKGEPVKAEAYQKKYRKIFAKAELIPEASVY